MPIDHLNVIRNLAVINMTHYINVFESTSFLSMHVTTFY